MAARVFGRLWLALLVGAISVAANVEKTIFVAGQRAPDGALGLPSNIAGVLPRLTPEGNAWRTGLPAVFPWTESYPHNGTTWVLLDNLSESQRYELRVCWAATQPTRFSVEVYDFATVATDPELVESLNNFVKRRGFESTSSSFSSSPSSTAALLHILAAADFVAADRSAMQPGNVPPVLTDIILDPYLFNVLPRSLAPIVAAILVVAGVSAWLARRVILPGLRAVAANGQGEKKTAKATQNYTRRHAVK
ncbi:hypothetical protein SBRCBS47491_006008 [Sporothrix bragantina]|uniref:Uncharacterized protein n=1 Tax=Sporothrix bragantina TaxID=671064 RepID=A0ABP0C1M9_9PEZI